MKATAREVRAIDIAGVPDLVRIVEEVRASREPAVLRLDHEDLALLLPVDRASRNRSRRTKSEADYQTFLSSFGSWKGLVDTERLKRDIQESRSQAARSRVEL